MAHVHRAVWIDHVEARVLTPGRDASFTVERIQDQRRDHQIHRKSGKPGSGKAPPNPAFFRDVAATLEGATAVLVLGPGLAKTEFCDFLDQHHPDVGARVVGVEVADHLTDGELSDHAHRYFARIDRLGVE